MSSNIWLAIFYVIALNKNTIHILSAQNSKRDYLKAHNDARAGVGVGPMTRDKKFASYAQHYANQLKCDCKLMHSVGGPYSENIAWSGSGLAGTEAVKLWVNETAGYNYTSHSCQGGLMCGHYTQVEWRNSVHLGCARVRRKKGGNFVICSYDPRGNYNNT